MKEIVFRAGAKLAITIPDEITSSLDIKEGEQLHVISLADGKGFLIVKNPPDESLDIKEWSDKFLNKHKELYEKLKDN